MTARRRTLRWLLVLAGLILLLVLAAGAWGLWFHRQMRLGLPQLDGATALADLSAPVTVTRDALGVPTVRGANRPDVARALGWLHAQDRFFQMDLMRRRAAGELAALFGPKAVSADKAVRIYDFRRHAEQDFALLPPAQQELLRAYAAGVNAGLAALRRKPFEYILLRATPESWRPEDSLLVVFAMWLELDDGGRYERSLAALQDAYGDTGLAFFAPVLTPADAALDGTTGQIGPMPSPTLINLRAQPDLAASAHPPSQPEAGFPGSNSFALSGAHTASGAPLLANDMHLSLRVPPTWYRATLVWPDSASGRSHTITGTTLPGLPGVIAGSNGRVAWGFTYAGADTSDIVIVQPNDIAPTLYISGSKLLRFTTRHEIIAVKGEDPVSFTVKDTIWGPVIGMGADKRPLVYHWTALLPGAVNLDLLGLETATTVDQAMQVAHRSGMPALNLLAVDTAGHIGWSIAGRLPRRQGFDGRLPVSWAYGDRYWDGLLPPGQVPEIINPPSGRLWTANNRLVGDPALKKLGDGGYAAPGRAERIRDDLARLEHATPHDLLAIQLDAHAPLLDRWQKLLLDTLTPAVTERNKSLRELRQAIQPWNNEAATGAVAYRLVRDFRAQTARLVFAPIFAPCRENYAGFDWHRFNYEPALWALVTQQPLHLLNPQFKTWPDLLVAAADAVLHQLDAEGTTPAQARWGQVNHAGIRHPLSQLLPRWLTAWLDMPDLPLPGDTLAPRVQSPGFGASERFVVSPGHESEGIFELPGGQSGNPLSPYYKTGFTAWAQGQPAPFLPGPTVHTLILKP